MVASGIANIYARDAVTAAQGYDSLNRLYGGRFILGLGVSHVPLVEGARGHSYGKPVTTMRQYLRDMGSAKLDPTIKFDDRAVVLAALGPKMLELASVSAKGALPYCVTPDHTAEARKVMGPEAWLCVEQKICLTEDEGAARAVQREQMAPYMTMNNYRNNWFRLGFTEEEVTGKASTRFLDAMVVWGNEQVIQDCIDAHFKAGADQVVIQAFRPDGGLGPDLTALKAFSPNG
jgi:probable F420-dependent oxidoreductase